MSGTAALAQAEAEKAAPGEFGFENVVALARAAADRAYEEPAMKLGEVFSDLSYIEYQGIRFRRELDPFANVDTAFGIDLLPPGRYYTKPVSISLVRPEKVEAVAFSSDYFHFSPGGFGFPDGRAPESAGTEGAFTGFAVRFPINTPDVLDEVVVFQGASYFRAIAREMIYGLSARGLAIGTADADGEEFPLFRHFWIHQPSAEARRITVHALLDSPSCSGAFEFDIAPGETTVMDTRARIFPRSEISTIGIAPLTSMYYFAQGRSRGVDDLRSAVHDSSGLQMLTGPGKRLFRSLDNPAAVQMSAFLDDNPKGYGLMQRHRAFEYYQDDIARYDRRPSAWVEPVGDWGPGAVTLVEIPVEDEFNDNIVAFWRPEAPLGPSPDGHGFAYRLYWGAQAPDNAPLARIAAARGGASTVEKGIRDFAVDFWRGTRAVDELTPQVKASAGMLGPVALRELPGGQKMRASFSLDPKQETVVELSLALDGPEGRASETWMYRWTAH